MTADRHERFEQTDAAENPIEQADLQDGKNLFENGPFSPVLFYNGVAGIRYRHEHPQMKY